MSYERLVTANQLNIAYALSHSEVGKHNMEDVRHRVQELGIEKLVGKDGKPNENLNYEDEYKTLEISLWKMAGRLKNKLIFSPQDAKNAINFLESFCFYTSHKSMGGRNFKKLEDRVLKVLNNLEYTYKAIGYDKKTRRKVLPQQVKTCTNVIEKIFSANLSETEKIALIKKIDLAKKILGKFAKQ